VITTSAFLIAQRFIGVREISGTAANPQIVAMLQLEDAGITRDEVAWCSAFVNYIAWLLRLPRSKSLAARSWLSIGIPIALAEARAENDVVIIKRGSGPQPGPGVLQAPGHVGFFAGIEGDRVLLLAGNQGDAVSVASFPVASILGVRRLG
jgi:uncharacterized protein (TIGR02594 family)